MTYFGPNERLWLIGPIALLMFWAYSIDVQAKGPLRVVIGVPFMLLNVMFNAFAGSLIFWELPREWFFTDRLKRHKRSPKNAETLRVATMICQEMNKADPGHC